MDYLFHIVPAVAVGLQITLKIFIITIVLSLPLGILMAIGRISKIAILRKAMYAYIYVMRGTPLMLQILFIRPQLCRLLCRNLPRRHPVHRPRPV